MQKILITGSDAELTKNLLLALEKFSCETCALLDLPQLITEQDCKLAIVNMDLLNSGLSSGAIAFLQQKGIPVIAIVSADNSFVVDVESQLSLPLTQESLFKEAESLLSGSRPKLKSQIKKQQNRRFCRYRI